MDLAGQSHPSQGVETIERTNSEKRQATGPTVPIDLDETAGTVLRKHYPRKHYPRTDERGRVLGTHPLEEEKEEDGSECEYAGPPWR